MVEGEGYPLLLRLEGRRCVVVGGGKVAARKVVGLLDAGAQVTVISPELDALLLALAGEAHVEIQQMAYRAGMLAELRPLLVFAATNSPAVNHQVILEARELNILANAADNPGSSDFSSMATLRRGAITIGIATGGASPALSAHLKTRLSALIGDEYVRLAEWLAELRPLVSEKIRAEDTRTAFWRVVLDSPALEHLRTGDESGARAIVDALWAEYKL